MARLVLSDGTLAKNATVIKVVDGGVVKNIARALVVHEGVCRQFFPTAVPDEDPAILWDVEALIVHQSVIDPADSEATITFDRATGIYTHDNYPDAALTDLFLNPPLDGTAGDDGKYLIKTDQVSGDPLTYPGGAVGFTVDTIGDLETSLRFYSRQDDESDAFGFVPDGTAANVTFGAGKVDDAATYNGASSEIDYGNVLDFERTSPQSWSFWFKTNTAGTRAVMSHGANISHTGTGWCVFFHVAGGNLGIYLQLNSGSNEMQVSAANAAWDDNTWRHCTITYDGGSLAAGVLIYVNGVSQTKSAPDFDTLAANITNSDDTFIGKDSASFYGGELDEVGQWGRVLSAQNALDLYNANAGNIITGGAAIWTDLNADYVVSLDATVVGTLNALATISIAQDDGAGAPVVATQVDKSVTFISEIRPASDIGWSDAQRDLEEITISVDADCVLTFAPTGTTTGDALTGSFIENWLALGGDATGMTVRCSVVSGTAPTGDAFDSDLALTSVRQWTLLAVDGEDFSCDLDLTIKDGAESVVKRITMHSMREDIVDDNVWTTDQWRLEDPVVPTDITVTIGIDGIGRGFLKLVEQETEDWHDDAPTPLDLADYEVRLYSISGYTPSITGSAIETWLPLTTERSWSIAYSTIGVLDAWMWDISIRKVGQPEVKKRVFIELGEETGV